MATVAANRNIRPVRRFCNHFSPSQDKSHHGPCLRSQLHARTRPLGCHHQVL
ncbi:hypothetical protein BJX65DRAFT_287700 [Aspergillus insuetus]